MQWVLWGPVLTVSSKGIAPHIEVKQTKLQEWMELDNAFVGNVVSQGEKAKL